MIEVDTEICKLKYDGDSLLTCIVFDTDITIDKVIRNYEKSFEITEGKIVKTLVDFRQLSFTNIPREALDYMSDNPYNQYQQAVAILIDGLALKLLANFYLKVFKPIVKTRVFESEESAIKWLNTIK